MIHHDTDFSLLATGTRCKSGGKKERKEGKRGKKNKNGDHDSISLRLVTVDLLASVFGKS